METKVEIEMEELIATVPASHASEADVKKFPSLRGGGYCCDGRWTIVLILILILIVVGFINLSTGSAIYTNDNNNTVARNASIVGALILALGILGCLFAICRACQNCCKSCCGCHLTCC